MTEPEGRRHLWPPPLSASPLPANPTVALLLVALVFPPHVDVNPVGPHPDNDAREIATAQQRQLCGRAKPSFSFLASFIGALLFRRRHLCRILLGNRYDLPEHVAADGIVLPGAGVERAIDDHA